MMAYLVSSNRWCLPHLLVNVNCLAPTNFIDLIPQARKETREKRDKDDKETPRDRDRGRDR